jgi:hypothetical protein
MRWILLVFAVALAMPAAADTHLVYKSSGNTPSDIYIRQGKVRLDVHDQGEKRLIFDSGSQELTILDMSGKTWTQINEATLEHLRETMLAASKQLQAQLDRLPPEKREQLEKMMPHELAGARKIETQMKATGETRTVAGHACSMYQFLLDRQAQAEFCVTPADRLGVAESDYQTLHAMFDYLQTVARKMGGTQVAGSEMGGMQGIPVYSRNLDGSGEQTLKEADSQALPDAIFQIPRGFSERRLDGAK